MVLYVHVPFCIAKCAYCAFYSQKIQNDGTVKNYLSGLAKEINMYQRDASFIEKSLIFPLSALFIGGGTPTALSEQELSELLKIINNNFHFCAEAEKTMEGNPGTLNKEKLKLIKDGGINRLSLGVQSFSDVLLKRIGRIHTGEQAEETIREARRAGFANLNLDLMFGLPVQTMADWQRTLEIALKHEPEHLSIYGLMIEEGTALEREIKIGSAGITLPDDDMQAEMYAWAEEFLQKNGYSHYETSNFSRAGYECRHNISYWQGSEDIGLGPGAVSFYGQTRKENVRSIEDYDKTLKRDQWPIAEEEFLRREDLMSERMMLGLRMAQGVDLQKFECDFGVKVENIYGEVLERYKSRNILYLSHNSLRLNPQYAFVANSVLQDFLL